MRENVKNVALILALIIAGVSLPTSIVSMMEKPTHITEINNYYYNNTVIEQSNNTGKHIIKPITYLPALDTGATLRSIWIDLNAVDEYMYATFFANSDEVDTSEDVIFRFIMNCAQTDATLQMLIYGAHTETDNTTTATFTWNIDNGVAISFNATATIMFIYEYTFDAADVENDDWLSFALKLNEAARAVGVMYAEVEYIHV